MKYILTAFRGNSLVDLKVFEGKPSKEMLTYTLNRHEVNEAGVAYCVEQLHKHGEFGAQLGSKRGGTYWFCLEMKQELPVNPERWVTILKVDYETDIETGYYEKPSFQTLLNQLEDNLYRETHHLADVLPFEEREKVHKFLKDVHENVNKTFEIELLGRHITMWIMKENWNPEGNFWISE